MRKQPRAQDQGNGGGLVNNSGSDALADYRSLGDPTVVTRALLAQINYIVDVAANMPDNTHTTGSGVFRLAWRGNHNSTTIVVRLRTVT